MSALPPKRTLFASSDARQPAAATPLTCVDLVPLSPCLGLAAAAFVGVCDKRATATEISKPISQDCLAVTRITD
jgi:hypothetical protein